MSLSLINKSAHASAAPWEGQNALDAAFITYGSISALRQQVKPTHRIHGIVEGRDWAANSKRSILKYSSLHINTFPSYSGLCKDDLDCESANACGSGRTS